MLALTVLAPSPARAQSDGDSISRLTGPLENVPELFFDARSSSFTRDGKQQIFEGDVIALGSGNVISADRILFDQAAGTIEADGHIVIISNRQVFTGERLRFFVSSGDFRLESAVMMVNDPDQAGQISRSILGFSQAEIDFEMARQSRLRIIRGARARLRESSRVAAAAGESLSEDLIDRYALLLEQEDLVRAQENPALARLGNDRRLVYQRRRLYWEKNREDLFRKFGGSGASAAYFRMGGQTIERKGGNDFTLQDALFTSCRCDPGEDPAWAIRAQRSEAQVGGYADFKNAVIEIGGVPVFYLPYFRVPVKDSRQSGFLLPVFSHDPVSGTVFSQPVYFDFGPSADMTVATEFFEQRGTRLSLEARQQSRVSEGWSLNLEGMRDQMWLQDIRRRQMLSGVFTRGLAGARRQSGVSLFGMSNGSSVEPVADQNALVERLSSPDYWNSVNEDCLAVDPARQAACDADLRRQLAAPSNLWRGSANWQGLKFLTPRFSVMTSGSIQTDHRYDYDLYLPDDFQAAVLGGRVYPAFHHSGFMAHYDARDFYAGAGSLFADNIRSSGHFDGEQIPLALSAQSRLFRLTPDDETRFPMYGNVRYRHLEIRDYGTPDSFAGSSIESLGDGRWQSLDLRLLAPVSSRSAVKVDQFVDAETRLISASAYEDRSTSESSWRLGVRFQLPLDGLADVTSVLPATDSPLSDSRRFLQHLMNWSVTFATRPVVVRDGPYGSEALPNGGGVPTYFQSDRSEPRIDSTDMDLPEEDQFRVYQTVGLSTSHRWRLFTRGWRMIPADLIEADRAVRPDGSSQPAARSGKDMQDLARRELLFALDRPLKGHDDMFGSDGSKRFFNRYAIEDNAYSELLTINSGITYDFRKASERTRLGELSRESRPWSEPFLDLGTQVGDWGLSSSSSYNIYDRTSTRVKVNVNPPSVLRTSTSFAYSQDKEVDIGADGVASYRLVSTRTANIATTIVPWFNIFASLARRTKDNAAVVESYETRLGVSFEAPSACWGVRLLRTKEFDVPEENAVYLLQLAVTFMGQSRALPNMAGAVMSRI
ncbi:hypothetical protein EBZ80_02795 [bacterium]|nr:hypothetical protein [bacterium]